VAMRDIDAWRAMYEGTLETGVVGVEYDRI